MSYVILCILYIYIIQNVTYGLGYGCGVPAGR